MVIASKVGREEGKMKRDIKVLLVDDQELLRCGLRHMLEKEEDMEVVGDCSSTEEAFLKIEKLSPDIILMDTETPNRGGIEATRRLKGNGLSCDADVILLAERSDYLVRALEAGAAGYLLKDIRGEELAQAIREVYYHEHPPEQDGLVEEVELLIPLPVEAAHLMRFTDQVEKRLHASILQTVGSWEWGAAITLLLKPTLLVHLLDNLRAIPEVEEVGELQGGDGFLSFLKKFKTPWSSTTCLRKRLLVTLK